MYESSSMNLPLYSEISPNVLIQSNPRAQNYESRVSNLEHLSSSELKRVFVEVETHKSLSLIFDSVPKQQSLFTPHVQIQTVPG